jgi:hypothetical protein
MEFVLAALGLTAAALVFAVAVDAGQFHAPTLWHCLRHLDFSRAEADDVLLVIVGVADAVVILRATRSLAYQLRGHRTFLRRLPVREIELHGHRVRVFPSSSLQAFCGGLLRPAVYVSEGTLRDATAVELRAILEHEAHHRARRDPLRLLLARVVSDAFRPLPPFATLAERQFRLADLAADAAAVKALGAVQPLASAFVRFEESASQGGYGIAPERVDQLVRPTTPEAVPLWLLAGATLGLGAIISLAIPKLLAGWHPDAVLPLALELATMVAAFIPACVAAHRADAWLRPA